MTRLFNLIWQATVHKDIEATWNIIHQFDPLIIKISTNSNTGEINMDLKSYIYVNLYKRIWNFNIFE